MVLIRLESADRCIKLIKLALLQLEDGSVGAIQSLDKLSLLNCLDAIYLIRFTRSYLGHLIVLSFRIYNLVSRRIASVSAFTVQLLVDELVQIVQVLVHRLAVRLVNRLVRQKVDALKLNAALHLVVLELVASELRMLVSRVFVP